MLGEEERFRERPRARFEPVLDLGEGSFDWYIIITGLLVLHWLHEKNDLILKIKSNHKSIQKYDAINSIKGHRLRGSCKS